MAIGASLWATALQTSESGAAITKTAHIGCQWGYGQLVIETDSPIFHLARATGLTVASWQDVIMVNQTGKRFWNELDGSYNFIAAAMAYNGDPNKLNGGGPIWAIFDSDAVVRERVESKAAQCGPAVFRERCDAEGTGGQHQQSVPEEADAGNGPAGDCRAVQLLRHVGRRHRLQEAQTDVQDREAALLCGVGDSHPP